MTNPVKYHPILGEKYVDEGDDETLDAAIAGLDRAIAKRKAREEAKELEDTIAPFFLVVVDDDRRLFTVAGLMSDDTPWVDRVCRAQESGRTVRCFTPPADQTREQIIASFERDLGLTYTAHAIA